MTRDQLDDLFRSLARQLHEGHMRRLGIAATMQLALAYNRAKFGRREAWRSSLYDTQMDALLEQNGRVKNPPIDLHDGWAVDSSMSLPHLDRVLEDSEKIIAERRGVRTSATGAYRSYFQDLWQSSDAEDYPSLIDFATSSEMLATVSRYLGTVPALSTTLPAGIRFVESNAAFDDQPHHPKDSQLFHIDYYSLPNVYVLVLLRDTTIENGPWIFLPRSTSQTALQTLGYWQKGRDYRVSDEELYSVVDRSEVIEFSYPRGTVLFIESSGCFHYGSRNSVEPRFQLMYGYTGTCRTDFSEVFMKPKDVYPIRDGDSLLRKMVLNRQTPAPGESDEVDDDQLPFLMDVLHTLSDPAEAATDIIHASPRQ